MAYHEKLPPVTVYYDGENYWLADGFHRVAAARFLRRTMIEAEVFAGTYTDLVETAHRRAQEFQAIREWGNSPAFVSSSSPVPAKATKAS